MRIVVVIRIATAALCKAGPSATAAIEGERRTPIVDLAKSALPLGYSEKSTTNAT